MPPEPRFLCDLMLGSLARWLRFLGYDTLYLEAMGDTDILRLAKQEERLLLTRDKELAGRAKGCGRLVRSDVLDKQIAQVKEEMGLDFFAQRLLSRCSLCNAVLDALSKEQAASLCVPPAVMSRHASVWRCPGCGQVYWPGSHYERIMGKIGELAKD